MTNNRKPKKDLQNDSKGDDNLEGLNLKNNLCGLVKPIEIWFWQTYWSLGWTFGFSSYYTKRPERLYLYYVLNIWNLWEFWDAVVRTCHNFIYLFILYIDYNLSCTYLVTNYKQRPQLLTQAVSTMQPLTKSLLYITSS